MAQLADTPAILYRPPGFIAGLDVGQMADPSALTVLERSMRVVHGQLEPYFFCGYLDRFPLQMPYPLMAEATKERLERLGSDCVLVIDATGVGRVVVDTFRQAWSYYDPITLSLLPRPDKPTIIAVTITNGAHATSERWDEWHVPKLDLVMTFMLTIERQHFEVARGMERFLDLVKEAQEFQWKKPRADTLDPYAQWRQGKQDDMLFAVMVAVWWGSKYAPRTLPGQQQQHAIPRSNPLLKAGGRR